MEFTVYMLECSDGTFYIGSTNDLEKRVHQHNHLKSAAKYTRARRPVRVVYSERFATLRDAKQREYQMKCLTREQKLQLLAPV